MCARCAELDARLAEADALLRRVVALIPARHTSAALQEARSEWGARASRYFLAHPRATDSASAALEQP